ncbi:MAG: hypothetical protein WA154_02625 [Moraxellaceae bacterium]
MRFKRVALGAVLSVVGSVVSVALMSGVVVAAEPAPSTIQVVTRPLIAGLWAMPITAKGCTEYYNFKENGEFFIRSAGERVTGKYEYELPELGEQKLPLLTIRIKYDNLVTDCAGSAVDQTNDVQQQFIKWSTPPHQIQFCSTVDGSRCEVTLAKVLP